MEVHAIHPAAGSTPSVRLPVMNHEDCVDEVRYPQKPNPACIAARREVSLLRRGLLGGAERAMLLRRLQTPMVEEVPFEPVEEPVRPYAPAPLGRPTPKPEPEPQPVAQERIELPTPPADLGTLLDTLV